MTTTDKAPCHITTIDQHRGDHHTGMRMMELVEIRTQFSDYCQDKRWERMSEHDRDWWAELLADLHAARVELASLDADLRHAAEEYLGQIAGDDLSDHAATIRRAIELAREDAR